MASNQEIEIKFRVTDPRALTRDLRNTGFELITRRTHEMNALYDLQDQALRKKGDLLRLRKYGPFWTLTHKSKGKVGRHKQREENETRLADGLKMDAILRSLDFSPTFRYEKFRAEWSDGKGHVVVDETPIGNFGEIEGSARWIDRTAKALHLNPKDYITQSYAELFFDWKKQTHSNAREMTFSAVGKKRRD